MVGGESKSTFPWPMFSCKDRLQVFFLVFWNLACSRSAYDRSSPSRPRARTNFPPSSPCSFFFCSSSYLSWVKHSRRSSRNKEITFSLVSMFESMCVCVCVYNWWNTFGHFFQSQEQQQCHFSPPFPVTITPKQITRNLTYTHTLSLFLSLFLSFFVSIHKHEPAAVE